MSVDVVKPHITISLDKRLQDFLHREFESDSTGVYLTNVHSIGIYIYSMWSVSDVPPRIPEENPIRLYLPAHESFGHVVNNHFLTVSPWKQIQIQMFIEAEWRRRIYDLFSAGYNKGYRQNDIIDAILKNYGMRHNAVNYDQIKKMDYRARRRFLDDVKNDLTDEIDKKYSLFPE